MQTKKKLVSIIVNCYNGEKYVSRCLKSIFSQTHKNFEIIFWDNLSTDKSQIELKKFKDKRIRYFKSKKFLKLYEARNFAINKAKGDYIAFLDIDDTWEKKKLQLQLKKIINTNSDVCFSNHFIKKKTTRIFKARLSSENIFNQILNENPISILTVMIKIDVFKKLKYSFNPKYEIIGDFDFFFRISTKLKFCCINEPLATYYIHNSNLSIKKLDVEISEFRYWINKNKLILKSNDNLIKSKNNIRVCNYLLTKNKLTIFSKEFLLLDSLILQIKFFIKILIYKF